jgi:hypothetical protein
MKWVLLIMLSCMSFAISMENELTIKNNNYVLPATVYLIAIQTYPILRSISTATAGTLY